MSPINPNFSDTITVFNKLDANDIGERYDRYRRTVIHDCSFVHRTNSNPTDLRQNISHEYVVRIPKSSNYLLYRELITSSKKEAFTLRIGDVIVLGECKDDFTESILTNYDAFRVKGTSENLKTGLPHYKAVG